MTHHVYVKRRCSGEPARPVAGPFATAAAAEEAASVVRTEGVARLYVNPATQQVFTGPSRRDAGPGSLNRRLPLAHLLGATGVDA